MPPQGSRFQAVWALHPPAHLPDPSRSRARAQQVPCSRPPPGLRFPS